MESGKLTLLLVLCIAIAAGKDTGAQIVKDQKERGVDPAPPVTIPSSSTTPSTPSTSTQKTTTSTHPTTTPVTKPTSTTKSTTTASTTTQTTTTKSTTSVKPTTPTSTVAPPTPGKPDVGTWNVTDANTKKSCIVARMAMQIEVDYLEKNISKKVLLDVPANASANGICGKDKQMLTLAWNTDVQNQNLVSFSFMNNTNTSEVGLKNLSVILNGLHLSNATGPMTFFFNKTQFEAPLKHSYKCDKEQDLQLISPKTMPNCSAVFKVSQVQIQAFRNGDKNDFDEAIDCLNASTPDIVPIAVGCALAALVVIVLLAYLYGRRRSQARGYLSM